MTVWAYELESPNDHNSSLAEFQNMFEGRGKDGWEYCGLAPDAYGNVMIFKRQSS